MSVAKETAIERLIQHVKDAMAVGKIAEMDKQLNINSRNPVENKVITESINGINNKIENYDYKPFMYQSGVSQENGKILCYCRVDKQAGIEANGHTTISLGALPSSVIPYQPGINVEDTDIMLFVTLRDDGYNNKPIFVQCAYIEKDSQNQKYLIKVRLFNLSDTEVVSTHHFKFDVMVVYNDWDGRQH